MSAEDIVAHLIGEAEDDLVKEVGRTDPFEYLGALGFSPLKKPEFGFQSWAKDVPNYKIIITRQAGGKASIHLYNDYDAHEVLQRDISDPNDFELLFRELRSATEAFGIKLVENVNDFNMKEVSLPTPIETSKLTNMLELCLDELSHHNSNNGPTLSLPFTILFHWLDTPLAPKVMGWDWPTFKEQVRVTYIPALINAGMEIQASDLQKVIVELDKVRNPVVEAEEGESWKELQQPTDKDELLDFMPPEFISAWQSGEMAEWENPHPDAYDWMPEYDDDDDTWHETTYYPNYRTEGRKLFKVMMSVDRDGDHEYGDEAEVGTEEEKRMDAIYGVEGWFNAMRQYWKWVIMNGTDPLRYLHAPMVEVTKRWIASFARDGDRLKLTAMRRLGQKPAAVKVSAEQAILNAQKDDDWKQALEFLFVDDQGYTQATEQQIIEHGGQWNAQGLLIVRFEWESKLAGENARSNIVKRAREALKQLNRDQRPKRRRKMGESEESEELIKDVSGPPGIVTQTGWHVAKLKRLRDQAKKQGKTHPNDVDDWVRKNWELTEAGEEDWKELVPPEGPMPSFDEVTFKLIREPERDINYRKEFKDSPDTVKWISDQLASGNKYAWFSANCEASWIDPILKTKVEGNSYLGGCSYRSAEDFMDPEGYWPGMKRDAYEDLIDSIKRKREKMAGGEAPPDAAMEGLDDEGGKDLMGSGDSLNWTMSPDPDLPNLYNVTYMGEPLGTIARAHMLHRGDAWFWFTHSFVQNTPTHRTAKVLGPFNTPLEAAKALLSPDSLKESANELNPLLPELAAAAQAVYDNWEQDETGESFEYGVGGICQDIAEEMAGVLSSHGIEAATVDNQGMGDQHVWVVAQLSDGVYSVDIEPRTYESGGGYCWKKRAGVTFSPEHIMVDRIDADPSKFEQYIGEAEEDWKELIHPGGLTLKTDFLNGQPATGGGTRESYNVFRNEEHVGDIYTYHFTDIPNWNSDKPWYWQMNGDFQRQAGLKGIRTTQGEATGNWNKGWIDGYEATLDEAVAQIAKWLDFIEGTPMAEAMEDGLVKDVLTPPVDFDRWLREHGFYTLVNSNSYQLDFKNGGGLEVYPSTKEPERWYVSVYMDNPDDRTEEWYGFPPELIPKLLTIPQVARFEKRKKRVVEAVEPEDSWKGVVYGPGETPEETTHPKGKKYGKQFQYGNYLVNWHDYEDGSRIVSLFYRLNFNMHWRYKDDPKRRHLVTRRTPHWSHADIAKLEPGYNWKRYVTAIMRSLNRYPEVKFSSSSRIPTLPDPKTYLGTNPWDVQARGYNDYDPEDAFAPPREVEETADDDSWKEVVGAPWQHLMAQGGWQVIREKHSGAPIVAVRERHGQRQNIRWSTEDRNWQLFIPGVGNIIEGGLNEVFRAAEDYVPTKSVEEASS